MTSQKDKQKIPSRHLLANPLFNKGAAFTREEREEFGLDSFLPYHVETMEDQMQKHYEMFHLKKTDLDKYLYLTALQNQNETLFFRLLSEHTEEMLPYIYTPTVGDACLCYSRIATHKRGIYLSYPNRERLEEMIESLPHDQVDAIVVTDGARILGLGDLGANGMPISIGKLALYTLFGGIHPGKVLPVVLDVGTDNESLLQDPMYSGWRHSRLSGEEYREFVDACIQAITNRFPNVLIQWEDFSKEDATYFLEKYQEDICCFNDDIQGTAGVVLSGIFAALQALGEDLRDQRFVFFGAGCAGVGVAHLLVEAMKQEGMGEEEAREKIYLIGSKGLAHSGSTWLDPLKKPYAQKQEKIASWNVANDQCITLQETIREVHPTILIGTSTIPGSFTREMVEEMKRHVPRPIIFPISNPTSKSEAIPSDLIEWTKGQTLIATGSPFPPVSYEGNVYTIGQCNNVYIFPGVALGALASRAKQVTDQMFLEAAKVISQHAPILRDRYGSLFPPVSMLREISREVAIAVGRVAILSGLSSLVLEDLEQAVAATIWEPEYTTFSRKEDGSLANFSFAGV